MQIKKSDLTLSEFNIINSSFKTESENFTAINFENYEIDIDFKIYNEKNSDSEFRNFMVLNINSSEVKLPGYSISILASGKFSIKNFSDHSPEEINNLVFRSSVPMMIANLRAFISNLTSFGVHGKYMLPSIDVPDLINNYIQNLKKDSPALSIKKKNEENKSIKKKSKKFHKSH